MTIEELADKYNTLRDEHTVLQSKMAELHADNTWRCPYGAGHDVNHLAEALKRILDLRKAAMSNMSHHIAALKNQMTAEQIRLATDGAAAPLLNARDEYNRAEAWKSVFDRMTDCETAHPKRMSATALELAKALSKARGLE